MLEPVTVHKLKPAGEVATEWSGQVLSRDAHSLVLEARFNRGPMPLGYVTLEPGDRFVETYYTDRWYNVFAIYAAEDGAFKGWYCNISRPTELVEPARAGEALLVRTVDLALDYFRQPDGREFILDQDEFEALHLPPDEQAAALAALAELQRLAAQAAGPFTV